MDEETRAMMLELRDATLNLANFTLANLESISLKTREDIQSIAELKEQIEVLENLGKGEGGNE